MFENCLVPGTKIALVTGGNRGIGFELSKQLAEKGYHVLLGSRDVKKGQEAAKKLQDQGLSVRFLELDVNSLESIQKAEQQVNETYGQLDVLINNAGIYLDEGMKLTDTEINILPNTLTTNLIGPYYTIRAFLPLMEKNNYGRIVNVSSGYGQMDEMNHPGTGSYKLSKLALNGLTRLLASEVKGNIKINAACPGWVRTDMGGPHASRSAETAAKGLLLLTELDNNGANGEFFRDGKKISW